MDNYEDLHLVELIYQCRILDFNEARLLSKGKYLYLKNFDFSRLDLEGIYLFNTIIEDCKFNFTILENALFCGSEVINCSFYSSVASKSIWGNAGNQNIFYSQVSRFVNKKSSVIGCSFEHTNLIESNWNETGLNDCNFSYALLAGINFSNTSFDSCNFIKAETASSTFNPGLMVNCINLS